MKTHMLRLTFKLDNGYVVEVFSIGEPETGDIYEVYFGGIFMNNYSFIHKSSEPDRTLFHFSRSNALSNRIAHVVIP